MAEYSFNALKSNEKAFVAMTSLMYVGDWKDFEPKLIIDKKRTLDRKFHITYPLFSDSVGNAYTDFMDACFEINRGKGRNLGLRTGFESRRSVFPNNWDDSWSELFSDKKSDRELIKKKYDILMKELTMDLNLSINIERQ